MIISSSSFSATNRFNCRFSVSNTRNLAASSCFIAPYLTRQRCSVTSLIRSRLHTAATVNP